MKEFEVVIADLKPGEFPCFSSQGTEYLILDRDGCFSANGTPPKIAVITEIAMLDTYIEYSKSRTGYHAVVIAEIGHNGRGKLDGVGELEIKHGWVSMTGDVYSETMAKPPQPRQEQVESLIAKFGIQEPLERGPWPEPEDEMPDEEIIRLARFYGEAKFAGLFDHGDDLSDDSRADWHLVKWLRRAGATKHQVLRLWKQSARPVRRRDEGKAENYPEGTIDKAFDKFRIWGAIPQIEITFVKTTSNPPEGVFPEADEDAEPPRWRTGAEIAELEIPEAEYVVDRIGKVGLTLLPGNPKEGKTVLSFQLAKSVSAGVPFLKYRVSRPGKVLYIPMEDFESEIQLYMRKQNWPDQSRQSVTFGVFEAFHADIGLLNMRSEKHGVFEYGIDRLERLLEAADYQLVIMDPLSSIIKGDQNDIQIVYPILTRLNALANKLRIMIVVVDHFRKGRADQLLDKLLGSRAKSAAPSVIWAFERIDLDSRKLIVVGRGGVVEQSIILEKTPETYEWENQGDPEHYAIREDYTDVINLTKDNPMTNKEIADALGISPPSSLERLRKSVMRGAMRREPKTKKYFLTENGIFAINFNSNTVIDLRPGAK